MKHQQYNISNTHDNKIVLYDAYIRRAAYISNNTILYSIPW